MTNLNTKRNNHFILHGTSTKAAYNNINKPLKPCTPFTIQCSIIGLNVTHHYITITMVFKILWIMLSVWPWESIQWATLCSVIVGRTTPKPNIFLWICTHTQTITINSDMCPSMPTHVHPCYSNCAHVFKNCVMCITCLHQVLVGLDK